MPYIIIKKGNTYAVKNKITGRYMSKHTTLSKAKSQIRLLNNLNAS